MTLTCPACNKPNQSADSCQRCGCDLSSLWQIRATAEDWLRTAAQRIRQQDFQGALAAAERSWFLFHSAAAAECAFALSAMMRDSVAAAEWHSRRERAQ